MSFNTGAAFGFLGTGTGWQVYFLALIALIVVVVLIIGLRRVGKSDRWLAAGLCLIIGGALSNCIDRLRVTYVIDFFDFHIKNWHFDTFNVADSAISIGAVFLVIRLLFRPR